MSLCAPSVRVVNASRLVSSGAAAARDLAAMADEQAAATCLICMDSISQDEESRTLRCMHVFHEECFGNCEQNANMLYSDGVLKCPGCSLTRGAAADRQTEMLAGAQPAINVSDSSGDIEEIIDDTVPASLPPADPVTETLANGEASPAEPEAAAANGETSPAEPDAAAAAANGETSPAEPDAANGEAAAAANGAAIGGAIWQLRQQQMERQVRQNQRQQQQQMERPVRQNQMQQHLERPVRQNLWQQHLEAAHYLQKADRKAHFGVTQRGRANYVAQNVHWTA